VTRRREIESLMFSQCNFLGSVAETC